MLFINKENPHVFYFEEKMFTNELKDGREAALKPRKESAKRPEFLVFFYIMFRKEDRRMYL